MDDPIHVEVEVVELDAVGIGLAGVDGDRDPVDDDGLLLDDVDHDHRVLLGQPPVERRHSHLGNPEQSRGSRRTKEGRTRRGSKREREREGGRGGNPRREKLRGIGEGGRERETMKELEVEVEAGARGWRRSSGTRRRVVPWPIRAK